jgi:hypothetical protein
MQTLGATRAWKFNVTRRKESPASRTMAATKSGMHRPTVGSTLEVLSLGLGEGRGGKISTMT